MSKRKPSKHSHSPKIAAKAHRVAEAVVKSPSNSSLRSREARVTDSSPKHNNPNELVEDTVTALQAESPPKQNDPEQEPLFLGNPATALQDDCKQMTDKGSNMALDFSSTAAKVMAYQTKPLEMAQANMQFALEFAQRLATIRSPLEFLSVIVEFTNKRIAMFQKYWKEVTEFGR